MGDRTILDALMEGDTSVLDGLQLPEAPPPAPGAMGYVQQFGSSLLQGAAGTTGEMLRGAGTVLGSVPGVDGSPSFPQAAYDVNEALPTTMEEGVKAIIPSVPGAEGNFLADKLPRAIGSMAPFLATGGLGSLAGLPPALAAAAGGALVSGSAGFYEAKYKGADEATQWKSFALNAAVGSSMALPVGRIFSRIDKASGGQLKRVLIDGAVAGGQNAGQQVASNIIAKYLYDSEREQLAGVAEAGGAGFLTGLILGAAAHGRRGGDVADVPQERATGADVPADVDLTGGGESMAKQEAAIPGMPEPAPTVDLTGGGESMAAQPGPVSPVSPGMSGGEAGRVALPAEEVQAIAPPVSHVPESSLEAPRSEAPPAPVASLPEDAAGVSRQPAYEADRARFILKKDPLSDSTQSSVGAFARTPAEKSERLWLFVRSGRAGDPPSNPAELERWAHFAAGEALRNVGRENDKAARNGLRERIVSFFGTHETLSSQVAPTKIEAFSQSQNENATALPAVRETPESVLGSSEQYTPRTPAPSPETKTAAPVEALTKDEGAGLPPVEVVIPPDDWKPGETTGPRNSVVEEELKAMGFDPVEPNQARSFEEVLSKAKAITAKDQRAGEKLINELEANPRPPTRVENGVLALEANRLINERDSAQLVYNSDPTPENQVRVDRAREAYARAAPILKEAGGESSGSLNFRRMMLKRDDSLAAMELRRVTERGGKPLSKAEADEFAKLHGKYDEAKKQLDAIEKRQDEIEANARAQETVDKLKREVRQRTPNAREQRLQRNKERMAEIVRSFATMRASANEFANPENYKRLVEFARLAIDSGAIKIEHFYEHARELLDKFGDEVRPHLTKAWDEAAKAHREELTSPVLDRLKAGQKPGRALDTLARHLIENGVTEREALFDALHRLLPGTDRTAIRDALTRYGQFRIASQDETSKRLRQIKQEGQKVAQIEALEKRMAPLKTGFDRGEPSNEYRRLQKRVEALKKETGIRPPVDPERALKSAEASRETYLRNRIADLKDEIATGKREARVRGEPPTSPEIKQLESELAIVEQEHKETFGKKGKTPEEKQAARDKARIAAIERTAKHYEDMVANWDLGTKEKPKPIDSPEYRAAVAHRDAARRVVDELRALADPKSTPEERATKAALTRLANETAEIQQRITFKDFGPREKPVRVPAPEVVEARAKRDRMKRQLDLEIARDEFKNLSPSRRFLRRVADTLKLPKAFFSSIDLSAILQQGGIQTGQDIILPSRWPAFARRMRVMFKALAKQESYDRVNVVVQERFESSGARKAGLELTGVDALTPREEAFGSSYVDSIAGISHSNRAFSTYLNVLRLDHFERMVAQGMEPEIAANLVNVSTGRGAVGKGKFKGIVDASGTVLWAPRLYISRFQYLLGQPFMRGGDARQKMLIAREYATSLAALGAFYSISAMYSAMNPDDEEKPTLTFDPTSPDFGKLVMGNTRIDPLVGLSQTTRLLAREGRALWQSNVGDKKAENPFAVLEDFFERKISPTFTVPYSLATGREMNRYGRPFDRADWSNYAPLAVRDIVDALEDQGVPKGTALGLLSILGVRLNVQEDKKKPKPAIEARR